MLVLGVQQSDSVTHKHISILFQILFPFSLLQNIEPSTPGCIVGPCGSTTSNNTSVCLFIPSSQFIPPHCPPPIFPFDNPKFVVWVYFRFEYKFITFNNNNSNVSLFFNAAYTWYHLMFDFLWLISLSVIISRSIHVAADGIISFSLMAEYLPLCIYVPNLLFPFICPQTCRLLPCLDYCKQLISTSLNLQSFVSRFSDKMLSGTCILIVSSWRLQWVSEIS